jgi:PAS domain S-box-containing protein
VVDRIETGVYAVDVHQRIVYWNYGAEKVTGFLSQEMLGRPCGSNLVVEEIEHNPALCGTSVRWRAVRENMRGGKW